MPYRIQRTHNGTRSYVTVGGRTEWPKYREALPWLQVVRKEFQLIDPEATHELVIMHNGEPYPVSHVPP